MNAQKKLGRYFYCSSSLLSCTFSFTFSANKCREYTQLRLRAPPIPLVQQWGKKLKLSSKEIQTISDSLPLRHALGKTFCLVHAFILVFISVCFQLQKEVRSIIHHFIRKLLQPVFAAHLPYKVIQGLLRRTRKNTESSLSLSKPLANEFFAYQ